jgi:spore maturation protein B
MFRASGALLGVEHLVAPLTQAIGIPSEVLPLALVRPFSGSASNGILAELTHQYGGNSIISHMAATIMGSTETTFYVLAVYFGVVNITRSRHAVIVGLFADAVGVVAAVWICRALLG